MSRRYRLNEGTIEVWDSKGYWHKSVYDDAQKWDLPFLRCTQHAALPFVEEKLGIN